MSPVEERIAMHVNKVHIIRKSHLTVPYTLCGQIIETEVYDGVESILYSGIDRRKIVYPEELKYGNKQVTCKSCRKIARLDK